MANLLTSFNAGVSGLRSAQQSLYTAGHNLANAQTRGYTRQQTVVTDSFYRNSLGIYDNILQVGTGTNIVTTRQIRNVFLDEQYRLQVGREAFYEINRDTVWSIYDMLGELDGQNFQGSINELEEMLGKFAPSCEDVVYKAELASIASQFIERAQVLQKDLNDYQTSLNKEVKRQVDAINDIVTEIRDLNKKIRKYEAVGESANDYRDSRNDLLDQLSEYINFEVQEQGDGTIMIYSEGGFLLDATNQYYLSTEYESPTSQLLKPVWANGGDYFLRGALNYSSEQETDIGSLRGLIVARGTYAADYTSMPTKPQQEDFKNADGVMDTRAYNEAMKQYREELEIYNKSVGASVIMTTQSQLDTLVHSLVTMINEVFSPTKELTLADGSKIRVLDEENALIGDDENETMGAELFSRRSCERYTKTKATVLDEDGNPQEIDVWQYNEEDPEDRYSLYTISQLVVNPAVLQNPSCLGVKYNNQNGGKDGYAHNELEAFIDIFSQKIGPLTPDSMSSYTVMGFYQAMVGDLGLLGNVWNGIVENQELTVSLADDERQNVMGVSSEEELSDLIKFQRCYDASSRYITTVDEMLEYLIERLA
ncbi:MAG: flagellar hook-associated protein FlgK [Lachnospiraceae bacterium]|nr:flagellar hook-associated protein FlgK [Lachnospiraceae bacterium]